MDECRGCVEKNIGKEQERILLTLMPFWTPLMAPLGISSIKSYLGRYGYYVKTVDANVHTRLWEGCQRYFSVLKEAIPQSNRGNFYNIGYNVLRNHAMAYINQDDHDNYIELVKTIVYKHYYFEVTEKKINELDEILRAFYENLGEYIIELIEKENPTIFGISVLSGTLGPSIFAFRLVKRNYPNITTIMGGGIFSDQLAVGSPDLEYFVKNTPYIDKIMIGEGENLFLKYLRGELPKEQKLYTLKDIGGIALDLSERHLPDLSDHNLDFYPYLGATASKSCPYQCSFCNVSTFWGKFRKKEAKQVVEEMIELYKNYKSQMFFMTDSMLNPIASDLANEFLKADTMLYWDGYMRVSDEVCNTENTLLWRKGGCYRARIGVESGSQHVLDLMGKSITPEQTKKALSALAYAGIKTTAYIVIGHPGETEEDFQKTLDFIEEVKLDVWEAECNPFGFTYTGQANSNIWADKKVLVYPETSRDILISQTWGLDCEPSREETYKRIFRFVEHCDKLGIPNPYSMQEIFNADERWRLLHKNAVPSLVEFKNNDTYIDDTKHVCKLAAAKGIDEDDAFIL